MAKGNKVKAERSLNVSFLSFQDENNKDVVSFIFQKIRYIYDFEERNMFLPITYPINEQFAYYQNSKGYQEEDDVKITQRKYGPNKYVYILLFGDLLIEMSG